MPIKNNNKKKFAFISSTVYFIFDLYTKSKAEKWSVCPGVPPPWCVSHSRVPGHCITGLLPSFGWSSANTEMNTSSFVSNRASTVFSMCQEMRSNDYKLHNYIPSLSSLSLNHGSLWCKCKLLQVLLFSECILQQVFSLASKISNNKRWGKNEDLLSMRASHCNVESQWMSQSCLWTFPTGTYGLRY